MALRHLRRYDIQARYAGVLSVLSLLPVAGAAVLAYRNYDHELGQIIYGSGGRFLPLFLGCVAVSLAPGAIGFFLGWSSAGQRRNEKPAWSWVGFFIGGLVLTLDLILLIAFWMLRLQKPM
ncbi:MAG: hypothetical protein PVI86_01255 [Phycisphaerae bacterium]|jgi:hypothetical protein